MFSPRLSTRHVALACRSLATSLRAGIPVAKAFDIAINKSGDPNLTRIMQDVALQIRSGSDITSACRRHEGIWPDLFLAMVDVAERTGSLPEVLRSLAEHYENNLRLQRDFRGQMILPMIQLIAAVLIVAFLIWLLGSLKLGDLTGKPGDADSQMFNIIGGLEGTAGAMTWLGAWALASVLVFVGYQIARRSTAFRTMLHRAFLGMPVIGHCMQSFAIARFSWSFALTQEAGLPIQESLESSFTATDNGAFQAAGRKVIDDVMNGDELSEALEHTQLFPEDFIQIVHVGETSGTIPETLERLSPEFEDQARRSLKALTTAAAWAVWLGVASFIGFIVIRFAMAYVKLLEGLM